MEMVKSLIQVIAKALVDHPEQVSIREIENGNTVIYELLVSKGDTGKVIGKRGRTVDAIRTHLGAIAGKTHQRLLFKIID